MNKVKWFVTYDPTQLVSFTITVQGNNLPQSGELWKMGLCMSFSVAEFSSCLLILTVIVRYSLILNNMFETVEGGLFSKMGQKLEVSLFNLKRGWQTNVKFYFFFSVFAMQLLVLALFPAFSVKTHLNVVKSKQKRIAYVKTFDGEMALTESCFLGGKNFQLFTRYLKAFMCNSWRLGVNKPYCWKLGACKPERRYFHIECAMDR